MVAQLDTLREGIRGTVTGPDDDGYDDARQVRNGMIDRRPAVIVQPVNAGDVMTAVRFAADNDMTVAVRGGGHSVPGFGTCDGGVVVDLSAMRGVRVDPLTQTARVSGGATWGDLNAAALPVRAGHHGRHHLDHRRRRPDPGRWHRLPREGAGAGSGQPAVGGRRHR